jgi:2-polyprenyl-6-methoxyphenol hydroxylase-like FAD-dependent oxidoreductase
MDMDVLVVGAGPTGLMLANQLVRRAYVRSLLTGMLGHRLRRERWTER